jgi:hypothetical protein
MKIEWKCDSDICLKSLAVLPEFAFAALSEQGLPRLGYKWKYV